ncbi:hypothetical protein NZK32_02215 [Cyanobium sp. FGCU-52]|nr:hypothetical protein [Cyanobium sp. FGCU52]
MVFLNNLKHGDHDPFKVYEQLEVSGFGDSPSGDDLVTCMKDVLIYSYEDCKSIEENAIDLLSSVFNEQFEKNKELYLGKSRKRMDVFIIRDPFNFFASRLTMIRKNPMGGLDTLSQVVDNWKLLADKVLCLHQSPTDHQIPILYNHFILDKVYQRRLSHHLHGDFVPASLQKISGYGGGSSFSTTSRTLSTKDVLYKAHKLLNFKRWMQIKHYCKRFQGNQPSSFLTRWKMFAADQE